MNAFARLVIVLSALAAAVLAVSTVNADAGSCIDRWSDAAPVVAANRLVDVEELASKAPKRLGGSIVKATLCKSNGDFTYDLVVRTGQGKLKSVTVDARNPF